MIPDPEPNVAENLGRWHQSGGPRRWVDAHQGRWCHDDWLALLEELRRSPYWPLDPAGVGLALEEARVRRHNLRRWERSGQARQWVAVRRGRWGHEDWLTLLENLARSPYWPLDPDAVGEVLEEIRQEWVQARRWEESGEARRWMRARDGRWAAADWPALREALQRAGFWPADPEAAEEVLRELGREWDNLRRWQEAGEARRWVEARRGQWGGAEWAALLDELRRSPYWPVDPELVGTVLEARKLEWWNLDRWRAAGLARRWVEARQGRWASEDWLGLQADLEKSEFWPVDPASLGRVLEEVRVEWQNLHRWQHSGQPRAWAESRRGRWAPADVNALLDSLRQSEFWPLDPHGVRQVLEGLRPGAVRAAEAAANRPRPVPEQSPMRLPDRKTHPAKERRRTKAG